MYWLFSYTIFFHFIAFFSLVFWFLIWLYESNFVSFYPPNSSSLLNLKYSRFAGYVHDFNSMADTFPLFGIKKRTLKLRADDDNNHNTIVYLVSNDWKNEFLIVFSPFLCLSFSQCVAQCKRYINKNDINLPSSILLCSWNQ